MSSSEINQVLANSLSPGESPPLLLLLLPPLFLRPSSGRVWPRARSQMLVLLEEDVVFLC